MKNFKIELRWGILFSLALMVWMLIEKNLGWHDEYIGEQLGYHFISLPLLYALVYYFALREKRESYYKGVLSWQRGVVSGIVISAVVALLSPLTQYFIYHFISPDYFQNIIAYQADNTSMTQEGAEELFTMKFYIIQAIFSSLSMGIVISAILALFLKKKKTT